MDNKAKAGGERGGEERSKRKEKSGRGDDHEMMRGLCKPEAVSPRGVFVIGYTLSLV